MSLKLARWFHRRGLSRGRMRGGRIHRWAGDHLFAPDLWRFERESVARAWLIGMLICSSPFLGLHLVTALLMALWFRANVPVALALQFLTNPLTMTVYYPTAYFLGCRLTGRAPESNGRWERLWHDVHAGGWVELSRGLWRALLQMGWPLFAGCAALGLAAGLLGWLAIRTFWPSRAAAGSGGPGSGHSGRIPAV